MTVLHNNSINRIITWYFVSKGSATSTEKTRPNAVTSSDKPVQYAILLTRMSKYLIQQRSIFQLSRSYKYTSCHIRSDSQTTGLTLTTCVLWSCTKRRGASNINTYYDVTGLLSAVWKVTLRSTCLGCLSWPGRRGVVYS